MTSTTAPRRAAGTPVDARRRRRRLVAPTALAGVALLLVGCGIRPTEGAVSAGKPAVRPAQPTATNPPGEGTHVIYLVHGSRVEPVVRSGSVDLRPTPAAPEEVYDAQVDRLLRELAVGPTVEESAEGWTTQVSPTVARPATAVPGDSPDLVRLDITLTGYDRAALGQIVCTLQALAHTKSFQLAGTLGVPQQFRCEDLRDPDSGQARPDSGRS